ncbi:MAG: GntR family transcriptional regulator [Anaerolineales bacterium]|jgi:GntR family transcriptional regulator
MAITTDTRLNQVKAYMLSYITQNNLKRNDQLPSEAAIAKDLGVSRNTLREAYISLENEGVIIKRHGIGTFVANPPLIQDSLNDFSPFAQIIKNVGYTPNFKTLSVELMTPPPDVCDVLKVDAGQDVRYISRLVYADNKPVIYVEDFLPPDVDARIESWDDFQGNMVEILADALQPPLHQIQSYIRAGSLQPEISQHFDLPVGAPILSVRSTIFDKENRPVTFSKLCFNSDVIELNIIRMI